MNISARPRLWPAPVYRWLIWLGFASVWTVALLIPIHVHVDWTVAEINVRFLFAKGLHVAAYAVLAMLTGWLSVTSRFRWLLMFLLAAHATATECIQQYVPGRTGRIEDIGIDLFGILLGCLVTWKWWVDPR
jgi:VanZ family protein